MEIIRKILRRGDDISRGIKIYSVKEALAILRKHGSEGASFLQGKTIGVDFSQTPSFQDPNEATMCVVALTSNGETGTLSHLPPNTENVSAIVESILNYHGEPASVCFVGGAYRISDKLLDTLYGEFSARDFAVPSQMSHGDIGGVLNNRKATLYPDRVVVKRYFDDRSPEQEELIFPKRKTFPALPESR